MTKELTKAEQRKQEKLAQKKADNKKKVENTMVSRKEVYMIVDTYTRQSAETVGEMLREPLRTNLIATMALADILKKKGIITEEEHIEAMNKIAEDMNASLESLVEGEENGQGESTDEIQNSYEEGTTDNEETQE